MMASYFYNRFDLTLVTAGAIGAWPNLVVTRHFLRSYDNIVLVSLPPSCAQILPPSLLPRTPLASSFGLMNIFARAMGGLFSDFLNKRMGFAGRLWAQMICLAIEGTFLVVFSRMVRGKGPL